MPPVLLPSDEAFVFSFAQRNTEKTEEEGVKLFPRDQVCLMCDAAQELCRKCNKDTYGSHWL